MVPFEPLFILTWRNFEEIILLIIIAKISVTKKKPNVKTAYKNTMFSNVSPFYVYNFKPFARAIIKKTVPLYPILFSAWALENVLSWLMNVHFPATKKNQTRKRVKKAKKKSIKRITPVYAVSAYSHNSNNNSYSNILLFIVLDQINCKLHYNSWPTCPDPLFFHEITVVPRDQYYTHTQTRSNDFQGLSVPPRLRNNPNV